MRIVTTRQPATKDDTPAAVALGYFDGVHLGHAAVLHAAKSYAQAHDLRLAVFTFSGKQTSTGSKTILLPRQKWRLLQELGVQTCYEPSFESFCNVAPEDFVSEMLAGEYNAKALFCGEDFGFGAQRRGNIRLLRQLGAACGMQVTAVPMASYGDAPVSSSRIKQCLAEGDIPAANAMLGRPYELDLPVQHGKHLGTTLGFPTANQVLPNSLQAPAFGVYVTQVMIAGKPWPSATGWGTRPTVDAQQTPTCETFIPGYAGDLYDETLPVRFYEKIADVQKFASLEALAVAVQGWARQAQRYFE